MSTFAATLPAQQQPAGAAGSETLEPVRTSITVIESLAADAPASIEVKNTEQIRAIPGVNLDDRLRMIPGFALFRRSSSLASHPTTQGVSLRGIGSSGASRTLVLWDGVPLSNPFGGWVYWTRVGPEEVGRVEVSRGTATSVFGDRALGGVVSIFSREPQPRRFFGSYEYGNKNTNSASASYSHVWRRFAASGGSRAFTTNGYYVVPEEQRGRADSENSVRFVAPYGRFDYIGDQDRFFVKVDFLTEERKNGTQMLRNSTNQGAISGHYSREWNNETISLVGFHNRQEFHSNFTSMAPDRNSETLSLTQSVPNEGTGGAAYWRHRSQNWRLLVGEDGIYSEGFSNETVAATGFKRSLGGTLGQHGTFFQFDGNVGGAQVYLGARHQFTGLDRQFFAPSAGIAYGHGPWRFRGSAYRSFRAPTLNELYRLFRVGNVVTNANPNLKNERLTGIEGGVDFNGERSRVSVTGFYNSLRDLITNVTISSTPNLITRQRQNADDATAKGIEVELLQRFGHGLTGEFNYILSDSTFDNGLRVPQIPRHQGSAQVTWTDANTNFTAGVRSTNFQFEDDLNQFVLPGFAVAHVTAQRRVQSSLWATFAMENFLDKQYLAGFTPLATTGAPRLWRAGLRWDGPIF